MMNQEEMADCINFKIKLVSVLEDVRDAAMCIIPIDDQDKKIIEDGLSDLERYIEGLKSTDTLREINQYIDLNMYLRNKDSIEQRLNNNKRNNDFLDFMDSIQKLSHDGE